jgi:hypothetical protein
VGEQGTREWGAGEGVSGIEPKLSQRGLTKVPPKNVTPKALHIIPIKAFFDI